MGFAILIMLIFHTYMICFNWTTVETPALMEQNIFSKLSYCQCWKATFGENICLWLIPVSSVSPTSGLDYNANVPVGGVLAIAETD